MKYSFTASSGPTSKHILQIQNASQPSTARERCPRETWPPSRSAWKESEEACVLMCACVRRMCLSHTRTGRGPCFPSALPFGYTVVSQTPLYTTHPIRKATTFTLDNTCTHTHIHTRTQEENQCWEDLASLPMVQSLGKWRGSAISGLLLLTTLFSCCWCFSLSKRWP